MALPPKMGCSLKLLLLLFAASALQATTFYVTVAGLGGEPDYEQRFSLLADETEKTLKDLGAEIRRDGG